MPPDSSPRTFASTAPAQGRRKGRRISAKRAVLTGLCALPLAALSAAYSLAVVLDTRDPKVSHSLYGELPKAKIRLGDLTIAEAVSEAGNGTEAGSGAESGPARRAPPNASELAAAMPTETRLRIEAQALSGLADTPYAGGALRQLAFIETDPLRRRTLLALARKVSRRDMSAAAQVAELQFQDGDLAEGLATLDQALEISDALDNRIFPLLLSAAQHRDFAPLLRARLARDPAWSERLARHAATTPASAPLFARVVGGFPARSRARSVDYGAPIIDGLATNLAHGAAFAAYDAYAAGPQDPGAFGTGALPPLDWRLVDSIDTGTRMLRAGGPQGPVVEIFAQARRSGEAARILLRLDPGTYRLGIALADPRGSGGTLALVRTCLEDGRELAVEEATSALDTPRIVLPFTVPAGCPYQSLRLRVTAAGEPVSALIGDVDIQPMEPAR